MRAVIIGYPIPSPQFDNYSILSAPAVFDYDALVIDPAGVSQAIEEVVAGGTAHQTYTDQPVVNADGGPLAVALAEHLRRRQEEVRRLLAAGGLVVCWLRPEAAHPLVAGFPGCDRYFWLPAPPGVRWTPPYLMPGEGTGLVVTDAGHVFAPLLQEFRTRFLYTAYLNDAVPGLMEHLHVIARSPGGAPVAAELRVGRGRVVFLPSPNAREMERHRLQLGVALEQTLERALRETAGESPPAWAARAALPGLDVLEERAQAARRAAEEAEARAAEAEARAEELARWRRLLWQEGKHGLGEIVREALRLLGFTVTERLDEPAVLTAEGQEAFLEVEGSEEPVLEYPYIRLQRRLERDLLETKTPKKGVLVVNGQRLLEPEARTEPYAETLRIAAENYRYCLMTSVDLFHLVRRVLEGAGEEERRAMRRAILETSGVFRAPEEAGARGPAPQPEGGAV